VEKGARSGRRVAAEGDLSMTAVPEKETEGLARRRRGRRDEREERDERAERPERQERVSAEALPGNLIVLPGERLSRAGGPEDGDLDADLDVGALDEALEGSDAASADGSADLEGTETDADGRRRRRRRGGRGRGRGRQQYDQPRPTEGGVEVVSEDEEFLED